MMVQIFPDVFHQAEIWHCVGFNSCFILMRKHPKSAVSVSNGLSILICPSFSEGSIWTHAMFTNLQGRGLFDKTHCTLKTLRVISPLLISC